MRRVTLAVAALCLAGCTTSSAAPTSSTTPTSTISTTTSTSSTTAPSTSTTSTSTSTTAAPATTTTVPTTTSEVFGTSVLGSPLEVIRRGDPAGTRVLVVGVIHGNEAAGSAIIDELQRIRVPDGVELWLVPTLNPDGQAIGERGNTNGVDLNRNFPEGWATLGVEGDWQYGGPAAASEPETQAMVELGARIAPDLVLWYHQDLFRISPGRGRDGAVRERYAGLTGLPLVEVTGGTYTGTAPQWTRTIVAPDGVGFTVELGPTLTADEARTHAQAVLTVAGEL